MRKFQFKWKTVKAITLVAVLIPLIVILVPPLFPWFSAQPDNTKHFVSTFVTAVIAGIIFVSKRKLDKKSRDLERNPNSSDSKWKKELTNTKELSMTAELYEIFLFIMLPTIALYGVIPDLIKAEPWWITGIFLVAVTIWYGLIQIPISNQYKADEGKLVKTHVDTFFGYMLAMGFLFTCMIFVLQS